MAISTSRVAWDDIGEVPAFRAAKAVVFGAETVKDAEFLARLANCIRRGKPIQELVELINKFHHEDD